jgi:hypothetical protein
MEMEMIVNVLTIIGSSGAVLGVIWRLVRRLEKRLEVLDDTNLRARRNEIRTETELDKGVGNHRQIIFNLYDEYKAAGGNSYIDNVIDDYKRSLEKGGRNG